MSSDFFIDDKKLKELDRKLQKSIDRSGLDRKTSDEVFDKSTLKTLEKFISDRVIDIIDFPISTGKEGNVFCGVTPDKKRVAVKIYRTCTSTFKHIMEYIVGDPRFKSFQKSRRALVYIWTKKEYKNLELLKKAKIKAPKPIIFRDNVLIMSYIGDERSPAPLLKDVVLENPEDVFNTIVGYIKKMYKIRLVHGDISAFNVLMYKKNPYLIDVGQSVLLDHPRADYFLKRDIHNLVSYFRKYNIKRDEEKIYKDITMK